jgi:hypothetical protein
MKDKIFLITQDKTLQELEATAYVREDLLQRLLSDYPDLLAGYQMNEANPRRWLLVAREMGIADDLEASERWSLDHLFLDQDGTPTLVEVKRATDTRIRREVAGQMLDYAANAILHWSPEVVRQHFEKRCTENGIDPTEAVAGLLEIDPSDSDEIESYWQTVFNKLKTGQVRLVFVADQIPKELKRIIEFLNEHMKDVEVLGVEMPQYVGAGLTTIVPKVIGNTSIAEQGKKDKKPARQWDESDFFSSLAENEENSATIAREIYDWILNQDLEIEWGKGTDDGRFSPSLRIGKKLYKPFFIWTSNSIQFNIGDCPEPLRSNGSLSNLIAELNTILTDPLSLDLNLKKYPTRSLRTLTEPDKLRKFLDIYERHIREVRTLLGTNYQ